VSGIELTEDIEGQQRAWVAERVGWAAMAVIAVAALAGGFGPGPLSQATASSPDGSVTVDYQRFVRNGGTTTVQVEVSGPAAQQPEVLMRVADSLLQDVQIEQITPEPAEARPAADAVVLAYTVEGSPDRVEVMLDLRPDGIGLVPAAVEVPGGGSASFWLFVYP
jgi:hypothetical protein